MKGLDINLQEVLERLMKISDLNELQEEKSRLTGKQGVITSLMKKLKEIPPEERREYGKTVNEYKNFIEEALNRRKSELENKAKKEREASERLDYTIPG
ncbi:MAG: phenylalanine--tRNA ligase subunit alpha, partial [Mesotoga sp.]|nr:phenylalanine--tRNA ligase subunit alpha [Mesotoga sp.]